MASDSSKVVFVVGNSRSGTTLIAKILSRNERVFTFEELHFFDHLWGSHKDEKVLDVSAAKYLLARLFSIQREGYLLKQNLGLFESEAADLLEKWMAEDHFLTPLLIYRKFLEYETKKQKKVIPCEQTPRNLFFLEVILREFPNALIVNIIRDPRDVLLSQKYKWKVKFLGMDQIPYKEVIRSLVNYHPVTISMLWKSSIRQSERFKNEKRILNIYFESLLRNPSKIMRGLCQRLDIEFCEAMLNVEQIHSSTELNDQGKTGIDQTKIGKWKHGGLNDTEVYICQKVTLKEMRRYGYNICDISPNYLLLLWYYFTIPFRIILAIMFNISRSKNMLRSIARRVRNVKRS